VAGILILFFSAKIRQFLFFWHIYMCQESQ